MGISIWQLLILLAVVILIFGTKKLKNIGGDLGELETDITQESDDGSVSVVLISTLLQRTGLSYTELRQVLGTDYLRTPFEVEDYNIVPIPGVLITEGSCDTSKLMLDPQLSPDALNYMHRFVRLIRKLDWDVKTLDQVINGNIDEHSLIKISSTALS